MCDTHQHPDPVQHLVNEWEHGAMNRREFFERALFVLGSVTAAEALLAACSPAVTTAPTTAPAAATSVPTSAAAATATSAATAAPTTAPTRAAQATAASTSPAVTSVPGAVDPSAVDTAEVTYPSGSVTVTAYQAKPKSGGPFPAVIVIHENRGLTDHIKDVTRRVANLGYVALGVDFLSRAGGTPKNSTPPADPTQAINALKQDDINADIVASVAYFKKQTFVKPKIGIMGFCWGGGNALMGAISSPDIVATIMFYGRNPNSVDDVQKVNGAVQANYGGDDTFINPGIPALEAAMKKYNKPLEYKIYQGANHAFFNDTGPRFNAPAAQDAWARLVEFYKKNLQA